MCTHSLQFIAFHIDLVDVTVNVWSLDSEVLRLLRREDVFVFSP